MASLREAIDVKILASRPDDLSLSSRIHKAERETDSVLLCSRGWDWTYYPLFSASQVFVLHESPCHKILKTSWEWGHVTFVVALDLQRQVNLCEFKDSLVYIMNCTSARGPYWDSVSKKNLKIIYSCIWCIWVFCLHVFTPEENTRSHETTVTVVSIHVDAGNWT